MPLSPGSAAHAGTAQDRGAPVAAPSGATMLVITPGLSEEGKKNKEVMCGRGDRVHFYPK